MTKIKVYEIESITAGKGHCWLRTDVGRIRKPIGSVDLDQYDFSEVDSKIVLIETRLLHWGRWLLKSTTGGLGYPSQATTVTALQGSPSTATHYYPDDPEAEEVERIVKTMVKEHKRWVDVLRNHYTRGLDTTADEVAKSMELPPRTYRYHLNMGRKRVEYCLKNA